MKKVSATIPAPSCHRLLELQKHHLSIVHKLRVLRLVEAIIDHETDAIVEMVVPMRMLSANKNCENNAELRTLPLFKKGKPLMALPLETKCLLPMSTAFLVLLLVREIGNPLVPVVDPEEDTAVLPK